MARLFDSRRGWARPVGGVAIIAAALLIPYLRHTHSFTLTLYDGIAAMIVVVIGLNIAMGLAGQFLLGIVAVFAVAGYATAWMVAHHPGMANIFVMCIVGAAAGAVAGLVIGLPALRVGEFYLALVSLFASIVVPSVAGEWSTLGGTGGLILITLNPSLKGMSLYGTFIGIILLCSLFAWAVKRSTVGRRFATLAASEQLAAGLGISGYRTKLLGSVLGSLVAGVAGAMYVYSQLYFGPTSGGFGGGANLATLLLAALVIGGTGTIAGPVIGGVLILGLNQNLNGFKDWTGVVFGGLLVIFSVFVPQGVTSELQRVADRLGISWSPPGRARRSGSSVAAPPADAVGPAAVGASGPAAVGGSGPAVVGGSGPAVVAERAALEVVGVSRAFGGVQAVDQVDLEVRPGTIHGLIGSNGSGKTTLLNLICGYYRVDSGQIRMGDARLDGRPPHVVSRLGVARTFQTPKLVLGATVLENVMPAAERELSVSGPESVFRLPRGVRAARESGQRAMAALDRLGLGPFAHQQAGELPHGTRRLVEVARAIAMEPRFFLVDEPAAGLSPTESDQLVAALVAIAAGGVGVLLIEHNVPLVLAIADRVTVMHQGKRLFEGTPEELKADQQVAGAFLGIDIAEAVG
ncbi:MAG: branched-chain amino acid ABC transporter ATP-binding protein/permease [Actinomycetota bacterium]|nr:branched-chain amino acid ABC transporter ATP-binding protein/permease [Actinomycetota bacterium]